VFLYAQRLDHCGYRWRPLNRVYKDGVMASALPVSRAGMNDLLKRELEHVPESDLPPLDSDPYVVSKTFGQGLSKSPFKNAGVMIEGRVWTREVTPAFRGRGRTLGDVVAKTKTVPEQFFVEDERVPQWEYLKGSKSEPRTDKKTGHEYRYSEGGMSVPDSLDRPARTILTGEGGTSASRFKHVIRDPKFNRLRRLTPDELEELNGFPRGWTATGMRDGKRAFMMGNALVVGIVERLGKAIRAEAEACTHEKAKHDAGTTRTDS
jgi:DNA (cytosine-5)-methyltransferase 1